MSNVIVNLAERRLNASASLPLKHPAGVAIPFDAATDAALITPEIRSEIHSGTYSADLVRRLPDAVRAGDRVLVIGGGLGVVTTLIAGVEGVERMIVAEPNTTLFRYIRRVHGLNGATDIEIINGLPAVGMRGNIQFRAEHDPRTSSPTPHNQPRLEPTVVPFIDLNLILAEERITLIICDTPTAPSELFASADLRRVDRILLSQGNDTTQSYGVCTPLVARGYSPDPSGSAILLRRSTARRNGSIRIATSNGLSASASLANLG